MTDDFATIISDLETLIASAATTMERLRALHARAPEPRSEVELDDWVRPGRIVKDFAVSRQHLHRLCKENPINGSIGFALRSGNRFLISLSRFEGFARQHPLRRRETK